MKKLDKQQMSQLEGGNFWDGVCAGVRIGGIFSAFLALTPVGVGVLTAGNLACTIRSL